ncbi:Hypothetical protein CINCED_3A008011 [Cinara cedri]|uniref:Uncharacterized protein n=1 Tax=Cinara cedri TaxID=506608 RepID=A0A5E4MZN8_9HEMI|nr:Hypothetical protein CINCED_3A008011 [Cinara cedri]
MIEDLQKEIGLARLKVAHVEAGIEEQQKLKWTKTIENTKKEGGQLFKRGHNKLSKQFVIQY